jgi:DNA-binding transcriptional MerR regulator
LRVHIVKYKRGKLAGGDVEELFKTAELVKRSGLTRQIVYEYITYGLIKEEAKTEAGHRLFSDKTLRQINLIRNLAEHGYSLREIREIFIEGRARRARESVEYEG